MGKGDSSGGGGSGDKKSATSGTDDNDDDLDNSESTDSPRPQGVADTVWKVNCNGVATRRKYCPESVRNRPDFRMLADITSTF